MRRNFQVTALQISDEDEITIASNFLISRLEWPQHLSFTNFLSNLFLEDLLGNWRL